MALAPGTRLGPYEIVAPLGAGGMGEVYRARDTRLGRDVAVKVLPSHLSGDPARRERFEREARAVSSLNHPHICVLYDAGRAETSGGLVDYLVMEHLEGETLADRLARGPLPPAQVLRFATEIADALDKAHRKGIVHRDLKPGNVMLTKSGAKLLDFGLAKQHQDGTAGAAGARAADGSVLPTATRNLTAEGSILGTFQYMAPEQLEGKEADARTDIFAFGVLLYEMVTGKKAFEGASQASLIAAIMQKEPPPMGPLAPMSPPALERVVRTCLAKDPEDRWQSARDLARELVWIGGTGGPGAAAGPFGSEGMKGAIPGGGAWIWKGTTAALALAALALAAMALHHAPAETHRVRLSFARPFGARYDSFREAAISPDGRRMAFVAGTPDGKSIIHVRSLDSLSSEPLAGTAGGSSPFWSPDSRFLAFFADGKLKRIDASGGPPQTLCDARSPVGPGTWNRGGVIVFEPEDLRPLFSVPATGGQPKAVTRLEPREEAHRHPSFLPDGRHFIYLADANQTEDHKLKVGSLESLDSRLLVGAVSNALYAPPGYLLFVRAGTLVAQPFDTARQELTAEPITLVDHVVLAGDYHRFEFSVSDTGVLVYRAADTDTQIVWIDRAGRRLEVLGEPGRFTHFVLSPDMRRVAIEMLDPDNRNADIWILGLARGQTSRFTFDPASDWSPIWSPDGRSMVFVSQRKGLPALFRNSIARQGEDEPLTAQTANVSALSWSPDGRHVLVSVQSPDTGWDLLALSMEPVGKLEPYLKTPFTENGAQFSPGGDRVAYVSNESGREEVYVRPFPGGAKAWQISTAGGSTPTWRGDGRELFFVSPTGGVMGAAIRSGPGFEAEPPRELFRVPGLVHLASATDGQRFLVGVSMEDVSSAPLTVVLHWGPSPGTRSSTGS